MRKSEITPLELCTMEKYSNGTSSSTLSIQGNAFMSRLKLVTSFYKSLSKSTAKTVILNSSGYIPGVDTFLDRFINQYMSNVEFRESFVLQLCKGYVAKVEGAENPQYGTKVLNFFLGLIAGGNKVAFEFVSGNLLPCFLTSHEENHHKKERRSFH